MPAANHDRTAAPEPDLASLGSRFDLEGRPTAIERYGSGHIHDTFRVRVERAGNPGYILQRVNRSIFKDVPALMENIVRVTGHMRRKLAAVPGSDPEREVLRVVPARDGESFFRAGDGGCWRCFRFIEHDELGERPGSTGQAREAGRLYGRFLRLLADLPEPPLRETIPRFHDLDRRLSDFHRSLDAGPERRRDAAAAEIAFVGEHEDGMKRIMARALSAGLPLRVTHNDTKFNNILFDRRGRGTCVIDLDTVMPGHVLYDFGDAIRSAGNAAREDEPDLERVRLRMEIFREFAAGYLGELGGALSAAEAGHLVFSARLMTFIIGVRFLGDYLDGDRYFKITRPGQNLQRARVQFRLLADMEARRGEMEGAIAALMPGAIS